jgi:hypothetical protein
VWMIESFEGFDLFVLLNFVEVEVAVLHDFECVSMSINTGGGDENFRVGAFSFF